MAHTMRAAVLDAPGPPSAFQVRDVPIPKPEPGQVLIRIKAFGLNRSEYFTRLGDSGDAVTWPRVLGIEAVGIVEEAPGGEYEKGQQVAAIMNGMGRQFDGGYEQYCCVPKVCCHPFKSNLDWATLGAIPESFQTAAGALDTLDLKKGDFFLIRGGTSALGLFAASIAKSRGVTVLATTRSASRGDLLKASGVDHVLVDDGNVAAQVHKVLPEGVHGALELVGAGTLKDTLKCVRYKGTACFAGMLGNSWSIDGFYPMDWLQNGVRLTAYGGGSEDLSDEAFQAYLDAVEAGTVKVPIGKVYERLEDIVAAHTLMEQGKAEGKIVILTGIVRALTVPCLVSRAGSVRAAPQAAEIEKTPLLNADRDSFDGPPLRQQRPHWLSSALQLLGIFALLALGRQLSKQPHSTGSAKKDRIKWFTCPDHDKQQCGYLEVPRDYRHPNAKGTCSLALRKLPAVVPAKERLGSILMHTGGPGNSNTWFAAVKGEAYQAILEGRYDMIGWDPRGINMTLPANDCYEFEADEERARLELSLVGLPSEARAIAANSTDPNAADLAEEAYWRRVDAHYKRRAAACVVRGNHKVLTASTSASSARDMLAIVDALGEEKLNFWGVSAGGLQGALFATMFPDRINRVFLHASPGVTDWFENPLDFMTKAKDGAKLVSRKFFEFCVGAGPSRCALARSGSTAEELERRMGALHAQLSRHPLPVASAQASGVFIASGLSQLLQSSLYDTTGWPQAALALSELEKGNGTLALAMTAPSLPPRRPRDDNVFKRSMTVSQMPEATISLIQCTDQWNFWKRSNLSALDVAKQLDLSSTAAGENMGKLFLSCQHWPFEPIEKQPDSFDNLQKTSFPLLFLANEHDPFIPVATGEELVEMFGKNSASLLVQDKYGHPFQAGPDLCAARHIRDYFLHGVVPESGSRCEAESLPFEEGVPQAWQQASGRDVAFVAALTQLRA